MGCLLSFWAIAVGFPSLFVLRVEVCLQLQQQILQLQQFRLQPVGGFPVTPGAFQLMAQRLLGRPTPISCSASKFVDPGLQLGGRQIVGLCQQGLRLRQRGQQQLEHLPGQLGFSGCLAQGQLGIIELTLTAFGRSRGNRERGWVGR